MKKLFSSYATFTRKERAGIVALCSVIVVLIGVYMLMDLWVKPNIDVAANARLKTEWEKYRRAQPLPATKAAKQPRKDFEDADSEAETPLPDTINVNAADSATLVRLKGIGPAGAGKVVSRRKSAGRYTSFEDLRRAIIIKDAEYEILKKHIVFGPLEK
jgi:DNA uptake protein ComE-like DNA-binding protein